MPSMDPAVAAELKELEARENHGNPLQGLSELGIRGTLADWDRFGGLARITDPALVIGAAHDTMYPAYMDCMTRQLPNRRSLICPNGSHLAQYEDPDHYFPGLIRFVDEVENNGRATR